MRQGRRTERPRLLADGGASSNDVLMQIQADLAGVPVLRARDRDLSALGAAHLAGQAAGLWSADGPAAPLHYDEFSPQRTAGEVAELRSGWRRAVARSRGRALPG